MYAWLQSGCVIPLIGDLALLSAAAYARCIIGKEVSDHVSCQAVMGGLSSSWLSVVHVLLPVGLPA